MPTSIVYAAAAAAFVGALIALALYHLVAIRPWKARVRERLESHDGLIGGGAGGAADRLAALEAARADLDARLARGVERLDELEERSRTDLSRTGFVRYDAYEDTGSNLSYAFALLNRKGDGVVISSIYSRNDTRTYGKAVEGFKPVANASEEELAAIERARGSAKA